MAVRIALAFTFLAQPFGAQASPATVMLQRSSAEVALRTKADTRRTKAQRVGQPVCDVQFQTHFNLQIVDRAALCGSIDTMWNSTQSEKLDQAAFQRSYNPRGLRAARAPIQRIATKLLNREIVDVVVFGNSMTKGAGLKNEESERWTSRMMDLASSMGVRLRVHNMADPGTTSSYPLEKGGMWTKVVQDADIVVIDYTITDGELTGMTKSKVTDSFTKLAVASINLPRRPAVMALETLFGNCQTLVTSHGHWPAIQKLKIPTVSYIDAMCPTGDSEWFPVGHPHPNAPVHEIVGRLVWGAVLSEMADVCSQHLSSVEYGNAKLDKATECFQTPATHMIAEDGARAFRPSKLDAAVWSFFEDAPGKPGWIAASGEHGDISFEVDAASGWIRVEYLATYNNIGDCQVWLDADEPGVGCTLHGLWQNRVSIAQSYLMKVVPGIHQVHFRSDGRKFKLIGLQSC